MSDHRNLNSNFGQLMFVKYPAPLVQQEMSKAYIGWVYVGSANLSESAW